MTSLWVWSIYVRIYTSALSQSKEISSDLCCFYGGGISHNENIMHSFQKFIVVSIPTTLPLQKQGYVN